jgi:hypothetical protein
MLLAAALLLALPAPAAPEAASAERPMLDAFRSVCDKIDTLDGMKAAAVADGWEQFHEREEPRIERLNTIGRDAIGSDGTATGANYRRTIGDRRLFLLVTHYVDESGIWGNGCRMYHFDAAAGIPDSELEAWMARKPTGIQDPGSQYGRRLLWEPGWRSGLTVEVTHVPATSVYREQLGLSGNVLVAQALGGF